MIRHVAFVAVAEVGADVGRQLVGLGEQHPVRPALIDVAPDRLEHGVRLGQVLAARALALDQVRHGIETEAVDAQLEPEVDHLENLLRGRPDCRS